MKALAIDSSSSFFSLYAVNEEKTAEITLYAPFTQSEKIVPLMEDVLQQIQLRVTDLDFTAASSGPGSFTGLRLAYAALKALSLAHNTPFYGIPTLCAIAYPYANVPHIILPVIDSKKERFYFSLYFAGMQIHKDEDARLEKIIERGNLQNHSDAIFVVGYDSPLFCKKLQNLSCTKKYYSLLQEQSLAPAVFHCAKKLFLQGNSPLSFDEGPLYIRASEAEENLKKEYI